MGNPNQYPDLLRLVFANGKFKADRTGADSVFGAQARSAAFLFLCLGFMLWSGCQTAGGTKFAPLDARLESLGHGGAQSMVLVNSSGQTLDSVRFRVYVWGQNQLVNSPQPYVLASETGLPERVPVQTYTFSGSDDKLEPEELIHFRDRDTGGECRILQPVTKVQIAGRCAEGVFRETWVMGEGGQLRPVGAPQN